MAIKELEYAEIEKLVTQYQNGNNEIGLEILNKCKVFKDKFKHLICDGKLDLSNRSIRAFINMFIPSENKAEIHRFKRSSKALSNAEYAAEQIQKIFYMYEPEEVEGIINMTILRLAKRYKNNGRNNFYAYLSSCFHFRLFEELMILVDDLTNLCYVKGNDYNEELIEASTYDTYDLNTCSNNVKRLLVKEESDQVGDNWLLGYDCEIFEYFTPLERKILMLKYSEGYSDESIAEQLGVCRHTIFRKRNKIVQALKEYATSKGFLKG